MMIMKGCGEGSGAGRRDLAPDPWGAADSTYQVRDPADGAEKGKHISELYQYYLTEGEDTRDTIAMDDFEQLVEAVVDHRREPGSTSLRDLESGALRSPPCRKAPQGLEPFNNCLITTI